MLAYASFLDYFRLSEPARRKLRTLRRSWQSHLALCAVAVTVVVPVLAPISLAAAGPDSEVNGRVTGEAPYSFGDGCSVVHQRFITTVHTSNRTTTRPGCRHLRRQHVEELGRHVPVDSSQWNFERNRRGDW